MADREANFANNWSATLTAEMGPTDLVAVVADTSDAPASPCYLVLDPTDNAKREFVWFDGTFTGTNFVTTSASNRYLPGSAAGSGITHALGAEIWATTTAQALDDIHDRINADRSDFDAHAHAGVYSPVAHTHAASAGSVLAYAEYKLTANEEFTTTLARVFVGNLSNAFTAPASGNVMVTVTANIQCSSGVAALLGLTLDGGSTEAQSSESRVSFNGNTQSQQVMICYRKRLTGLSGSQTVELMARELGGSAQVVGSSTDGFESYVTMTTVALA